MKVIGYTRVSTKGQKNNNSLEQQEKEILSKYPNAIIYKEQFTGAKVNERPILQQVISELQEGDTLVVSKLDRLARNTTEGIELIRGLFDKGVSAHVLNIGLLENSSMGKFFITIMLAVAEMERNMIAERMQSGKEIAKTKEGYKEGRPKKYSNSQLELAYKLKQEGNSYKQVEQMTGICKQTLWRYTKKLEQK